MYEEDRQTALAMYNQLFDEVDDEQGLLQLLVSPTRQAVVIARSYNAKERKLQVHAQSREESETASDGAAPEFMGVIESIREEALSRQAPKTAEVSADQFSMFEDDFFAPTPETPAAPAEAEPEAPAEEAAAPVAEAEAEAPAETAEPATDEPVDEVDAFIADFAIPADRQEFAPDAGEQTAPAEPAEPAQPEEAEATLCQAAGTAGYSRRFGEKAHGLCRLSSSHGGVRLCGETWAGRCHLIPCTRAGKTDPAPGFYTWSWI
mgnify:CR=1 FL=1